MGKSLFGQSWYRVALLKPRLGTHVEIHRHNYRGHYWFVLQDHFTGRHQRFSTEAYHIIGLMDGRRTLGEIWETVCIRLGAHMPTQDEVIGLLSQLHRSDLLHIGSVPDFSDMQRRRHKSQRSRLLMNLRSPMAIRFPLFDPDRLLDRTLPYVKPFIGGFGAIVWVAIVTAALVMLGVHWTDLLNNVNDQILSLQNLVLISLIYPAVKVLHEFGHAYMVKRWGGEVHEMGVLFLVLMPIPYVDASSSLSFHDKRQRMLVGAAGIMVELFLAAVAMLVWVNLEPGAVRAAAFNVMFVSGVSTLLFNGNPLLRFDAYYILSDYLEIPNLGMRGNKYIGYLFQKYLLGVHGLESPVESAGEKRWLLVYALASFIYRLFISVRIVLFIAGQFFVVGILLAVWAGFSMFVEPLWRFGQSLFRDARMQQGFLRPAGVVTLPVIALLGVIFLVRFPLFTVAEGVVWAPDESRLIAATDGFVRKVLVSSGEHVEAGTPLLLLENPELLAQIEVLKAQVREYQSRYQQSRVKDLTEAEILVEEIAQIEAKLTRLGQREKALLVRSEYPGILILPDQNNLVDRYVSRGDQFGFLLRGEELLVRVLVPQADIDRIMAGTRRVSVRLNGRLWEDLPAQIIRQIPSATNELPSLALSLEGGGLFALDPSRTKPNQAFEHFFMLDVRPEMPKMVGIEERAYVRFVHEPEPLAQRWYQAVRRLFLKRFDI